VHQLPDPEQRLQKTGVELASDPSLLARIAHNEALFREQNSLLAVDFGQRYLRDEPLPFLCECADGHCTRTILLTLDEYSELRSHPAWFAVLAGHELDTPLEQVVDDYDRYRVIEKLGGLAELVARPKRPVP
jgi:hypothetical protein